jgi:hypothetical protein
MANGPHVEMERDPRASAAGRVALRVRQIPLLTSYRGPSDMQEWFADARSTIERLQRRGA